METDVRAQMQANLKEAMKERRTETVSVLRSALAAIANAEAVDLADHAGSGATEVDRRVLTATDIRAVLHDELAQLRAAAETLRAYGRADVLEAKAATLEGYLQT